MIYKYRNYIVFLFGLTIVYYSYETRYLSRNIYVTTTYAKHLQEWEKVPFCPALNESDWELLKELTTPYVMVQDWEREDLGIEDLGFVTYASFDHLTEAIVSCNTIRAIPELLNVSLTVYLSPDVTDDLKAIYKKICPHAKFILFPFEKYPEKVKDLNNYIFKPLYIAEALKNHKVLLNFDSSIVFMPFANFTNLIQTSVRENPLDVSLLRTAYHSNFLTTHPKMYDCFPNIKPSDMSRVVQYNAGLVLWIGSEAGWTSMHRWVECALQPSCMAPLGSTKSCTMKNISQSRFSGCHRFDQAAINLILYENSNSTTNLYQRNTNYFKIIRRRNLFVKPKIKETTIKRIFTDTTKSVVGETTATKRPFFASKTTKLQFSAKSTAVAKVTKSFSPIMSTYNKKNPTMPNTPKSTIFSNISYISQTTVFSREANNVSTSVNVIEFDLVEESMNGSINIPDSKKSTITTKLPQTSVTP